MALVIRVMGIVGDTEPARGLGENLLTQAKVVFLYLKMIALPIGLSIDHVAPTLTSPLQPIALVSILGVIALVGASLFLARKAPIVTFGIWWPLIALVPTSTLIALKLVMNEQRLYAAAVGVLLIAGAGFATVLSKADEAERRRLGRAAICLFVAILAIFSALTIRRNVEWRDPRSLWMSALEEYPDSMRANAQIASQYLKMDRPEAALPHAEKAVEAGPDVVETQITLARALSGIGSHKQALTHARVAVDLDPDSSDARSCLGAIHARLERWDEAETAWRTALELNPNNEDARFNLERLRAMREDNPPSP
jgi:cytochrome c-type biogenesis protein CcmH/NrfG